MIQDFSGLLQTALPSHYLFFSILKNSIRSNTFWGNGCDQSNLPKSSEKSNKRKIKRVVCFGSALLSNLVTKVAQQHWYHLFLHECSQLFPFLCILWYLYCFVLNCFIFFFSRVFSSRRCGMASLEVVFSCSIKFSCRMQASTKQTYCAPNILNRHKNWVEKLRIVFFM